ncbi:glyoxalase [Furfurilactobacillus milii]|uniref:Glyoxalase n=1 Tax=Furfurilactobacillus rossiae TaxID=231049 RepID=A0A7C9MNV9_9LACO|nr:glyoxalase [Furfurilactobacillus milii]MYV05044.1 glyoxalase [Furfurilactobacillus milii]
MIVKNRIMLYVTNVAVCANFWHKYFRAEIAETNEMPDNSQNIVLRFTSALEISLFTTSFIKRYSPEVSLTTPSLMLFSDEFEQLHKRLPNTGHIIVNNGVRTFNFADPEGHFFVIAEQLDQ